MSDPKLISPMLDNFDMGDPISDRNGVRCCPAMLKDSDSKYIVKIISVPASQTQLDALLLSGAFPDAQAATEYFKTLAEDILKEAETLEKLSRLEGFLPYESWQLVPMDSEAGYDVYLLSSYCNTLAQHFRHNAMTHLEAINLGLDLCAALTVSRRLGYLYVDLKPENVYISPEKSFRIGDIGFIRLDNLKYASLPDRYRSAYTAPEIADAFSCVSQTADVYALGLILYQAFNGGQLPALPIEDGAQLPAPDYADYEMAEIILKACSPDPEQRWQDPVQMGQALVSYMQRNGANDTPIIPVVVPDPVQDTQEAEEDTQNVSADEASEDCSAEDIQDTSAEETAPVDEDAQSQEDPDAAPSDDVIDETDPEQLDEEIAYDEVSDEVSGILTQADELISHPTPDPVIPPEKIDVPMPAPIVPEDTDVDADSAEEESGDDESSTQEDDAPDAPEETAEEIPETSETQTPDLEEHAQSDEQDAPAPKKRSHWFRNTLLIILALALAVVGYLFYTRYYLQPIDSIQLQDLSNGEITVLVNSQIEDDQLTVICEDTYGNQLRRPVINGKAKFTGLAPASAYTIQITIDGFHRLTGDVSTAFTTPMQTNLVQFQAVTGAENGSVILNFTIDGPDSAQWKITYSATDEETRSESFTGHMHKLSGLTIGNQYTFTLTPEDDLNFTGENTITHIPAEIVKASKLLITGCVDNVLTAKWSAPEDAAVANWTVRCYNDSGYDQTQVVTETSVSFEGVDPASEYTVEVTAAGMSVSERAFAAANSVTVTDFVINSEKGNQIQLSWKPLDAEKISTWKLFYSVDGSALKEITAINENAAVLDTMIPNSNYTFVLQTDAGAPVLGGQQDHKTTKSENFSGYGVTAKNMNFRMCKRPAQKNWDRFDLKDSDYTSSFGVGKKASFLVRMNHEYNTSKDKITTLYVIRDANGVVIDTATTVQTWTKMWYNNYCELDIPTLPQSAGEYTISVFFNGAFAHQQNFTITE